ncbi:TBPIP-domain-containing protein [Aspergillus flavus]|uniref:TBPIP-domain-containing protein n=1 Tax=Aspergillus flavus TaxID=5059 RepID=A0A5N6GXN0_ASPFL|nr:TBPIP-domain-containing protein [Aspergillus flavus]
MKEKGQSEKMPNNGTVNDGPTLVLDYLRKQNRPYSATDVSANLHNKVTKRRQAVYHALQKGADESTLERMVVLDDHILQLQEQLTDLKGYVKRARAELATLRATPLAFDLQKSINQLQVEKETTFAILTQARGTSAREVDEEGRTITKRVWERWQKRVNLRRKEFLGLEGPLILT